MQVLSDCVWTGVPKPYFFYEFIADGVVGEGEGDAKDRNHVGIVDASMHLIADPHKGRHF